MGTSIVLKSKEPVPGKGCGRGWYAVEPRGYVCSSPQTTLDLEEPYFKALAAMTPGPEDVWHYHYAFSNDAPMYSRVPTDEEADKFEKRFGASAARSCSSPSGDGATRSSSRTTRSRRPIRCLRSSRAGRATSAAAPATLKCSSGG